MRSRLSAVPVLLLALAAPSMGAASDQAIGMQLGSAGLGVEYLLRLTDHADLRAGYWLGALSQDREQDGVEYEARARAQALSVIAQLRPFAGGFRINVGAYSRPPVVELDARGRDEYDLGNARYTGDLVLDGEIDWNGVTPYVGVGWGGTSLGQGWGMSFDLGVLVLGDTRAHLDVSGRACDSSVLNCDPNGPTGFDVKGNTPQAREFQDNVDAEERRIEQDGDDLGLWPVMMLGLHYRF